MPSHRSLYSYFIIPPIFVSVSQNFRLSFLPSPCGQTLVSSLWLLPPPPSLISLTSSPEAEGLPRQTLTWPPSHRWVWSLRSSKTPPWAFPSGQRAEPCLGRWPSSGPSWFQVSPRGFPGGPSGMHPRGCGLSLPSSPPLQVSAGDQAVTTVRDGGVLEWSYDSMPCHPSRSVWIRYWFMAWRSQAPEGFSIWPCPAGCSGIRSRRW